MNTKNSELMRKINIETFVDYHDDELVKKGHERAVKERNWNYAKSTQLNILANCGYKTCNFGSVKSLKKQLKGNEEALVLVDINRKNEVHCWKLMRAEEVPSMYDSNFAVEFIEADEKEEFEIVRMLRLGPVLIQYELGLSKDAIGVPGYMVGSSKTPKKCVEIAGISQFGSDEGQNEYEASDIKFVSLMSEHHPFVEVDFVKNKGEFIAIGLNVSPKIINSPMGAESIASPEQIADLYASGALIDGSPRLCVH